MKSVDFRDFQGRIFTKHPIYCSIQMIGDARSTGTKTAPAPQVCSTTQRCTMGDIVRMSGKNYLGKVTRVCGLLPVNISLHVSAALSVFQSKGHI